MLARASVRERVLLAVAVFLAIGLMYMYRYSATAGDWNKARKLSDEIKSARTQLTTLQIPLVAKDPDELDKQVKESGTKIAAEKTRLAALKQKFAQTEIDTIQSRRPQPVARAGDEFGEEPQPARFVPRLPDPSLQPLPRVSRVELERARDGEVFQITRLEQQLAGSNISSLQDLKVRISVLARDNGVLVRENVPHVLAAPQLTGNASADVDGASLPRPAVKAVNWLDPRTLYRVDQRPLQRLTVEANYTGLRGFLIGLNQLPRHVIVVQFEIDTLKVDDKKPVPGMLKATILLGL